MYCYQCQETARNIACTVRGVCGKEDKTSNLQDLLIYSLCGISYAAKDIKDLDTSISKFICESLFSTITNANFSNEIMLKLIDKAISIRDGLNPKENIQLLLTWNFSNVENIEEFSKTIGINALSSNEDIKSLKSLILYGLKGVAAYTKHAFVLEYYDNSIFNFINTGLAALYTVNNEAELLNLVMETGNTAVKAMSLLDKANTTTYGNPEITKVNIGVKNKPGILISGHDLKDMEELLIQTENSGVDVYTHSEMLPANYYPKFKKYPNFVGNYGNSWWMQNEEFTSFNGPILMTTNCITPVKDAYKDRIFTTGMAGYPGVKHIADRVDGKAKDFSELINLAKKCPAPTEIETGEIIGGFAHHQVLSLADKVVSAVKAGKIKRFVVMAGCDGRHKDRNYFTELANNLPKDTVILTAGCAKYRYNKLKLGDIDGIPRVLDAGQCNDSYSLAVIALKLKEVFGLNDINELPISYDIAWYEQKAVAVLLALLSLGVKGIRLGPTLPAFVSPNVLNILVEKFNILPTETVEADIINIMQGK